MKEELCAAFCDGIVVSSVPAGKAISTSFVRDDGDRVSFYAVEREDGQIELEDDGATVATLEAAGVDFSTETRSKAFESILGGAGAFFDEVDFVVRSHPFGADEIGARSLSFVSALLRLDDFLLLTPERVASTFKEDAAKAIRSAIGERAEITENEPIEGGFDNVSPDMLIRAPDRPPVAVFFGNSAGRVHDSIFLQMAANESRTNLSVMALLENRHVVPEGLQTRAQNRLSSVQVWEGDKSASVSRIQREVLGMSVH